MDTRYIFVTGGVTSSLGKGITAASLGRLLKARGYTAVSYTHLHQNVTGILCAGKARFTH